MLFVYLIFNVDHVLEMYIYVCVCVYLSTFDTRQCQLSFVKKHHISGMKFFNREYNFNSPLCNYVHSVTCHAASLLTSYNTCPYRKQLL